jgi:hypothetical protein
MLFERLDKRVDRLRHEFGPRSKPVVIVSDRLQCLYEDKALALSPYKQVSVRSSGKSR